MEKGEWVNSRRVTAPGIFSVAPAQAYGRKISCSAAVPDMRGHGGDSHVEPFRR